MRGRLRIIFERPAFDLAQVRTPSLLWAEDISNGGGWRTWICQPSKDGNGGGLVSLNRQSYSAENKRETTDSWTMQVA